MSLQSGPAAERARTLLLRGSEAPEATAPGCVDCLGGSSAVDFFTALADGDASLHKSWSCPSRVRMSLPLNEAAAYVAVSPLMTGRAEEGARGRQPRGRARGPLSAFRTFGEEEFAQFGGREDGRVGQKRTKLRHILLA